MPVLRTAATGLLVTLTLAVTLTPTAALAVESAAAPAPSAAVAPFVGPVAMTAPTAGLLPLSSTTAGLPLAKTVAGLRRCGGAQTCLSPRRRWLGDRFLASAQQVAAARRTTRTTTGPVPVRPSTSPAPAPAPSTAPALVSAPAPAVATTAPVVPTSPSPAPAAPVAAAPAPVAAAPAAAAPAPRRPRRRPARRPRRRRRPPSSRPRWRCPCRARSSGARSPSAARSARFTHVGDYAYVQLNAAETDRARALKAAHPGLKVLVYKDMSSTRSYAVQNGKDDAKLPTGVGFADAAATHPEWFLKDTTGARMEWPWDGHWWMDVADPAYQARWLQNVRAELAAGPWDGVIIDNVMASPEWYLEGRTIAKYPTKATYSAATESFLRAVAPQLVSTGKLVLGNISDASPATWDRWTALLSGANHEHSFSWSGGELYGGASWLERVQEIERTQRAGRIHTATSSATSTDLRALTYLRASWLLAWDGGASGSAQMVALSDRRDPWNDVVGQDLGQPVTARTAVGGAWKRDFTGGTAVVNPGTTSVTVPVGPGLRDRNGTPVTASRSPR